MNRVGAVVLFLLSCWAPSVTAFQVSSGLSDPCHERMTVSAASDTFGADFISSEVPIPTDDAWEAIAEQLVAELGVEIESDRERFMLVSFAVGSRYPDARGTAILNVDAARDAHAGADDQYDHALRRPSDDFEKGNLQAVQGARESIRQHLSAASSYLSLPDEGQILHRDVYVDFYGPVRVPLWGPAFHLGFASHTLQDSFSHSLRSPDHRTILHVFNFIEAARGEHEDERDGLRHSTAMDECEEETPELAAAAEEATEAMYQAFLDRELGGDPDAVEEMFEEWLSYEPGCTFENDFCDSQWLSTARTNPSRPVLRRAFACQTAYDGRTFALWAMVLAILALVYRRRLRRRSAA